MFERPYLSDGPFACGFNCPEVVQAQLSAAQPQVREVLHSQLRKLSILLFFQYSTFCNNLDASRKASEDLEPVIVQGNSPRISFDCCIRRGATIMLEFELCSLRARQCIWREVLPSRHLHQWLLVLYLLTLLFPF